ncbi:golgin subfamily A member 6-like protein 6 [Hyperolius riggenbachi]|uniref:golgin subfamily A member 6-like protein 6 n=1 Tax=Hyperolius riggenbachi TaxID=752182 RepID=UPI0035A3030C
MASRGNTKGRKAMVGITSRSAENNLQWLIDYLNTEFYSIISPVTYLPITNTNQYDWERNIRKCTVGILYHTTCQGRINITDVDGALYQDELSYMHNTLGKKKVLVVLDDMGDVHEQEKLRILQAQPTMGRLSSQIILMPANGKRNAAYERRGDFLAVLTEGMKISELENRSYRAVPNSSVPPGMSSSHVGESKQIDNKKQTGMFQNFSGISQIFINSVMSPFLSTPSDSVAAPCSPRPPACLHFQISIFSRSAENNYSWLIDRLEREDRLNSAKVKSVAVTNSYQVFSTEMAKCQFAIVYHTQKQGRINITDVTDSLYDGELKDLSKHLGRENVIVVIDDLRNAGFEEKKRLANIQPSICRYAKDFFLFTEKEKDAENLKEMIQTTHRSLQIYARDNRLDAIWTEKHAVLETYPSCSNSSHGRRGPSKMTSSSTEHLHNKAIQNQDTNFDSPASIVRSGSYQNKPVSPVSDSEEPQSEKIILDEAMETDSMQVVNSGRQLSNKAQNQKIFKMLDELKTEWISAQDGIMSLEKELKEQESKICFLNNEIHKKDNIIIKQEKKIQMLEKKADDERKCILWETEKKIKVIEQGLLNREKRLQEGEMGIDMKERELRDKEKVLIEEEKRINILFQGKEKEMIERERKIQEKERFLEEEQGRRNDLKAVQKWQTDYTLKASKVQTETFTEEFNDGSSHTEDLEMKEPELTITDLLATLKKKEVIIERMKEEIKSYQYIAKEFANKHDGK